MINPTELEAEHIYDAFNDAILQAENVTHIGGYGAGRELSHAHRVHEAIGDPDPVA